MAETDNKPQEQAATAQPAAAPQPQQGRPCPKDCRKCSWMQQVCCSSMMSFQMFGVMNAMMEKIDAQSKVIADLSGRIAALEISGTELSAPTPVQGDLFPLKE